MSTKSKIIENILKLINKKSITLDKKKIIEQRLKKIDEKSSIIDEKKIKDIYDDLDDLNNNDETNNTYDKVIKDGLPDYDGITNRCLICGLDLGPLNPRQYCMKSYCPMEYENEETYDYLKEDEIPKLDTIDLKQDDIKTLEKPKKRKIKDDGDNKSKKSKI